MDTVQIRAKYTGFQSRLGTWQKAIGKLDDYGCLFLSICSIAEEYNESHHNLRRMDILSFFMECLDREWVNTNCYCLNQLEMLKFATGVEWKREVVKTLPKEIPLEMYTVEHWYNARTGFDHFRRRWGDTLVNSVTVKEGVLKDYYTYTHPRECYGS